MVLQARKGNFECMGPLSEQLEIIIILLLAFQVLRSTYSIDTIIFKLNVKDAEQ